MATSGRVTTNEYSDCGYYYFDWSCTGSGNTSTINWKAGWHSTTYGSTEVTLYGYTVSISVTTGSGSRSYTILPAEYYYYTGGSGYIRDNQLKSGSFTITHNSSGNASFTVSLAGGIYQWTTNVWGSGSFSLPTRITKNKAPTNINISKSVVIPNDEATISWSGAAKGNANSINNYQIWRSTSKTGTYTNLKSTGSTTSTSGSSTVNASTTRGETYYYKMVTCSPTSGFSSDLSSVIVQLTTNSLPTTPQMISDVDVVPSYGGYVHFSPEVESTDVNGQEISYYYAYDPADDKIEFPSDGNIFIDSANPNVYFWSYDTLEFSEDYQTITFDVNVQPTIAEVDFTCTPTYYAAKLTSNHYSNTTDIVATVSSGNIIAYDIHMLYRHEGEADWQENILATNVDLSTGTSNYPTIEADTILKDFYNGTDIEYYFEFFGRDGIEETPDSKISATYYMAGTPVISNYYSLDKNYNVIATNPERFCDKIRITVPADESVRGVNVKVTQVKDGALVASSFTIDNPTSLTSYNIDVTLAPGFNFSTQMQFEITFEHKTDPPQHFRKPVYASDGASLKVYTIRGINENIKIHMGSPNVANIIKPFSQTGTCEIWSEGDPFNEVPGGPLKDKLPDFECNDDSGTCMKFYVHRKTTGGPENEEIVVPFVAIPVLDGNNLKWIVNYADLYVFNDPDVMAHALGISKYDTSKYEFAIELRITNNFDYEFTLKQDTPRYQQFYSFSEKVKPNTTAPTLQWKKEAADSPLPFDLVNDFVQEGMFMCWTYSAINYTVDTVKLELLLGYGATTPEDARFIPVIEKTYKPEEVSEARSRGEAYRNYDFFEAKVPEITTQALSWWKFRFTNTAGVSETPARDLNAYKQTMPTPEEQWLIDAPFMEGMIAMDPTYVVVEGDVGHIFLYKLSADSGYSQYVIQSGDRGKKLEDLILGSTITTNDWMYVPSPSYVIKTGDYGNTFYYIDPDYPGAGYQERVIMTSDGTQQLRKLPLSVVRNSSDWREQLLPTYVVTGDDVGKTFTYIDTDGTEVNYVIQPGDETHQLQDILLPVMMTTTNWRQVAANTDAVTAANIGEVYRCKVGTDTDYTEHTITAADVTAGTFGAITFESSGTTTEWRQPVALTDAVTGSDVGRVFRCIVGTDTDYSEYTIVDGDGPTFADIQIPIRDVTTTWRQPVDDDVIVNPSEDGRVYRCLVGTDTEYSYHTITSADFSSTFGSIPFATKDIATIWRQPFDDTDAVLAEYKDRTFRCKVGTDTNYTYHLITDADILVGTFGDIEFVSKVTTTDWWHPVEDTDTVTGDDVGRTFKCKVGTDTTFTTYTMEDHIGDTFDSIIFEIPKVIDTWYRIMPGTTLADDFQLTTFRCIPDGEVDYTTYEITAADLGKTLDEIEVMPGVTASLWNYEVGTGYTLLPTDENTDFIYLDSDGIEDIYTIQPGEGGKHLSEITVYNYETATDWRWQRDPSTVITDEMIGKEDIYIIPGESEVRYTFVAGEQGTQLQALKIPSAVPIHATDWSLQLDSATTVTDDMVGDELIYQIVGEDEARYTLTEDDKTHSLDSILVPSTVTTTATDWSYARNATDVVTGDMVGDKMIYQIPGEPEAIYYLTPDDQTKQLQVILVPTLNTVTATDWSWKRSPTQIVTDAMKGLTQIYKLPGQPEATYTLTEADKGHRLQDIVIGTGVTSTATDWSRKCAPTEIIANGTEMIYQIAGESEVHYTLTGDDGTHPLQEILLPSTTTKTATRWLRYLEPTYTVVAGEQGRELEAKSPTDGKYYPHTLNDDDVNKTLSNVDFDTITYSTEWYIPAQPSYKIQEPDINKTYSYRLPGETDYSDYVIKPGDPNKRLREITFGVPTSTTEWATNTSFYRVTYEINNSGADSRIVPPVDVIGRLITGGTTPDSEDCGIVGPPGSGYPTSFPNLRPDGTSLQNGDYVKASGTDFTIENAAKGYEVAFSSYNDTAIYLNGKWYEKYLTVPTVFPVNTVGPQTIDVAIDHSVKYKRNHQNLALELYTQIDQDVSGTAYSLRKTFNSKTVIVFSQEPTIAYRHNHIGINTEDFSGEYYSDAIITIHQTTGKDSIVFSGIDTNSNDWIVKVDINAGNIKWYQNDKLRKSIDFLNGTQMGFVLT